jgi:hypothetical protein
MTNVETEDEITPHISQNLISIADGIWSVFENSAVSSSSRCTDVLNSMCVVPSVHHTMVQNYTWWFETHATAWMDGHTHLWSHQHTIVCLCITITCVCFCVCIRQQRVTSDEWLMCKTLKLLGIIVYCFYTSTFYLNAPKFSAFNVLKCVPYDFVNSFLPTFTVLDFLLNEKTLVSFGCTSIRLLGWEASLQLGNQTIFDNITFQLSFYSIETVLRVCKRVNCYIRENEIVRGNTVIRGNLHRVYLALTMFLTPFCLFTVAGHLLWSFGLWENIKDHSNQFSLAAFVYLWANLVQTTKLLSDFGTR